MPYVLIVDDDVDFAEVASRVLREAGYEASVEHETGAALQSMERRKPDLVILDVMFPEDNSAGFEMARTMRHHRERLKDVPILMLTAVNARFPLGFGQQDIDDYWLPVSEFLEKPVDLDLLRNKVRQLLADRAASPAESGSR